ncbi:DMT family transporter [Marinovum sp. 2_MG-2023]|uniref:DMT family transporter n=1 Tax=unclassified Marinovum TaxID=2647166 RepID=UPI0026E43B57|nr:MULTISPECIES: DMT family transporter [unclassified Marinovum]MDO6732770.1 DMT family transporter [Marinovum sp. 2_MG-2023]MDO6781890.1 DMT family transporter [Marinovum sp. 1_MG-2023]
MSTPIPREDKSTSGVLWMALGVMFFTCIDTSAKWLILAGIPALQVVFARYMGHLLVALVVYLPQEGRSALVSNSPGKQFLRSAFLLGSTALNFTALQYLPITVTTTIMFAGPVVVTLLAIPILGEKVGLRRIIAVCVGFFGVIVVMQPWGAEFHPAMILSLGALVMASMYFVMTRLLAGVEGNATQQIWSSGIAAIAILPFALADWHWPTDTTTWLVFAIIGVFGACGHICATIAHRLADASLLAPVIYIQIFSAAAAGILVFATWPTIWTLGGGGIIIASGLYIWQRERAVRGRVRRPVPSTR